MSSSPATKPSVKMPAGAQRWINTILVVLWAVVLVFLAQNAISSQAELEPRAAMVFWVSFVVILIAGAIIAAMRGMRRPNR